MDEEYQKKQDRQKKILIAVAVLAAIALCTAAIIVVLKNIDESIVDKEPEDTDIKTAGGQALQVCLNEANIGSKRALLTTNILTDYIASVGEDTKTAQCEQTKQGDVFKIKTDKTEYKLKIEKEGYIEAKLTLSIGDNETFSFDTNNYPRKYIENEKLRDYLPGYVDHDNKRDSYYYFDTNTIYIHSDECNKDEMNYVKNQVKQQIFDLGADAETLEYHFVNQMGLCGE